MSHEMAVVQQRLLKDLWRRFILCTSKYPLTFRYGLINLHLLFVVIIVTYYNNLRFPRLKTLTKQIQFYKCNCSREIFRLSKNIKQ